MMAHGKMMANYDLWQNGGKLQLMKKMMSINDTLTEQSKLLPQTNNG